MYKKLMAGASMLLLFAAQVEAATLQMTGGLAWVASGNGVFQATNNIEINPGDRIRVVEGCVLIVYRPGAETKICKGEMAVVQYVPPAPASSLEPAEGPQPVKFYTYLLPGLAVAGGAGAALAALTSIRAPVSP
jgi:hypothetical protein